MKTVKREEALKGPRGPAHGPHYRGLRPPPRPFFLLYKERKCGRGARAHYDRLIKRKKVGHEPWVSSLSSINKKKGRDVKVVNRGLAERRTQEETADHLHLMSFLQTHREFLVLDASVRLGHKIQRTLAPILL